jgi:TolB-like protein
MMRRAVFFLVLLLAAAAVSGCVFPLDRGRSLAVATPDFFGLGEELCRQLVRNRKKELASGKRLIMTTFVDIDDLGRTSRFGRLLAESLATRMFARGYGVVEVRRGRDLLMEKGKGELVLTRGGRLMAQAREAEAVVAGTYGLTPESVIVNARLLDAGSGEVLSVAGMEIERSPQIDGLLARPWPDRDMRMSAYER